MYKYLFLCVSLFIALKFIEASPQKIHVTKHHNPVTKKVTSKNAIKAKLNAHKVEVKRSTASRVKNNHRAQFSKPLFVGGKLHFVQSKHRITKKEHKPIGTQVIRVHHNVNNHTREGRKQVVQSRSGQIPVVKSGGTVSAAHLRQFTKNDAHPVAKGTPTATIYEAWWTNKVDEDGDGTVQSATLNWDPDVTGGTGVLLVKEKVSVSPAGENDWQFLYETDPHLIQGGSAADQQYLFVEGMDSAKYDFEIEIFQSNETEPDYTRQPSNDTDLSAFGFENADQDMPPTAYFTETWWNNEVDNNDDGYVQSATLNWDEGVSDETSTLEVYEEISVSVAGMDEWESYATTDNHTIEAVDTNNSVYIEIGNYDFDHNDYDWKIEVYRTDGAGDVNDVRDASNDDNLAEYGIETADQDIYAAYNSDAWWTDELDNDDDGYTSYAKLTYDPDVDIEDSVVTYEEIYWSVAGADDWNLYTTTDTHTIYYNDFDEFSVDVENMDHDNYDWAIIIYTIDNDGVTSYGPDEDEDLMAYPLENYDEDTPVDPPFITFVQDVKHDQGGKVMMHWDASSADYDLSWLTYYSVWRAIPQGGKVEGRMVTPKDITIDFHGKAYYKKTVKKVDYIWEWLGNTPAHMLPEYAYAAATLYDSSKQTKGKHYFMVSAQTADPNIFFDSDPDSGYSVDNIAPFGAKNVAGTVAGGQVHLHWNPSQDMDLRGYKIYRSTNPNINPDILQPYATTSESSYVDVSPLQSAYYAVVAEDIHDNNGALSNVLPVTILGVHDITPGTPLTFALNQNFPNPFNPTTNIRFDIAKESDVSLRIFDVLGRQVASVVEQHFNAGSYSADFDASQLQSGTYFYRLVAHSSDGKNFTEMKKMLLLK